MTTWRGRARGAGAESRQRARAGRRAGARRSSTSPGQTERGSLVTRRHRWTESAIDAELAPVVAELGRMPTNAELRARGLGGAYAAMRRHGGLDAWRRRLTAPTHETIATRAYFIALERGGDELGNWLTAERELLAA
jgi:Protein of unknown function (DUF2934)